MARPPPRRTNKRTGATRAGYYHEGRRHLTRALALHPEAEALDALVASLEAPPKGSEQKLRPATARRYLEDCKVIVAVLARAARRAGMTLDPEPAILRIEAALRSRRGRPASARGASLRVVDATNEEARHTFVRLKANALRDRSMTPAAAALYVLVEPRIGVRPVELCGAWMEGDVLLVRNAKRADGQAEWRPLDLGQLPTSVVEATRLLTLLAPEPGDPRRFEQWRNGLASSLARASRFACGRRLSLYSFRHVAIATWEAAGFSAEEIARLAGHVSLRTAAAHYARGRSGWALDGLPRSVIEPEPSVVRDVTVSVVSEVDTAATIDTSDAMVEPSPSPKPTPPPRDTMTAAREIGRWFDRLNARNDDLGRILDRMRSANAATEPVAAPARPKPRGA